MATTMQLSDLMIAVRQRADMLPSGYVPALTGSTYFVTDPELVSYINQSYFELYDLLVSKFGDNYFVKTPPYEFTTTGTTDQYVLPPDFYKLLGVDISLGGDNWATLRPFEFGERNRFASPVYASRLAVSGPRYRLNGSNIWLTPLPGSGLTLRLWYVPRPSALAALTDTVDGVSGWTEYVIVDAAIKCLQKEESDVTVLMAQKAGLMQRIEAMAENRDAGSPARVTDVWAAGTRGYGDPFGEDF